MRDDVRQDLANIWTAALEILEEGNLLQLKELSNHTVHDSSIYRDEFSITAAVILYSLYKIAQRGQLNIAKVVGYITELNHALTKGDNEGYRGIQKALLSYISDTDLKFRLHVDDVLKQAKIKKGWKLYEHGLSLGSSAEMLGISKWDLMNYIGNTTIADQLRVKSDVKSRLKYARSLFVE